MPTRRRLLFLSLCIALAIGCGGGDSIAPVSGVVTLDDKPVAQADIQFQPMGDADNLNPGPGSVATTDDAGHFVLQTIKGEPGAIIGNHRVVISSHHEQRPSNNDSGIGEPVFKDPIPARYNAETTLTFEVPEDGTSEANFKLTTAP